MKSGFMSPNSYTAALIALDRETGKVVDRWQAHTEDNLCRNVVIHPTRPKAYLSHIAIAYRDHSRQWVDRAASDRSSISSRANDTPAFHVVRHGHVTTAFTW